MIPQHIQIETLKMLINRTWTGPFRTHQQQAYPNGQGPFRWAALQNVLMPGCGYPVCCGGDIALPREL